MALHETTDVWVSMIQECRSSGQTVKEWCREHDISVNSYYYNLRKLRKLALTMPVSSAQQSPHRKQEIVQLTVAASERTIPGGAGQHAPFSCPELSFTIECNGISVTCPDGISASTICSVVHALRPGC